MSETMYGDDNHLPGGGEFQEGKTIILPDRAKNKEDVKMKYRIKVEALEGVSEEIREMVDERLTDGIECEGFALICEQGERAGANVIHDMTVMRLADLLGSCSETLQAATLAKALYDAKTIDEKFKTKELFLEGLKNFMDAKKTERGEGK